MNWIDAKEGFNYWYNISWRKNPQGRAKADGLYEDTDSIVESIVSHFKERSEVGRKKYGTTLDRKDLTELEWRIHFREELMDAILYNEKIINEIQK